MSTLSASADLRRMSSSSPLPPRTVRSLESPAVLALVGMRSDRSLDIDGYAESDRLCHLVGYGVQRVVALALQDDRGLEQVQPLRLSHLGVALGGAVVLPHRPRMALKVLHHLLVVRQRREFGFLAVKSRRSLGGPGFYG